MKRSSGAAILVAAALLLVIPAHGAGAGAEQALPTQATIHKGRLIDDYPGEPSRGSTDLVIPFYGRISAPEPCQGHRSAMLVKAVASGEPIEVAGAIVDKEGHWRVNLFGRPEGPSALAIQVFPKTITAEGTTFRCEGVISSTVMLSGNDFTACKVARAAKRGYVPGIHRLEQEIRETSSESYKEGLERRLADFKKQRPRIWREAKRRCQ